MRPASHVGQQTHVLALLAVCCFSTKGLPFALLNSLAATVLR